MESAALLHFLSAAEASSSQVNWLQLPGHFIAPNGININSAEIESGFLRRRFPDFKGRQLMLFLGRLHPIKGLDLQLQALSRLVKNNPLLLWVLIGPDSGEWQRLSKDIRTMGLGKHVRWLGAITGHERLLALADADVVVQTSIYECYSVTVSEALAVGAPLVITETVHRPEVQDIGAGLVVSNNPDELARAVEEILHVPERAKLMRAAGRCFAARDMTWERIALIVSAAYKNIVGDPARSRATGTVLDHGLNNTSHQDEDGARLLPKKDLVA